MARTKKVDASNSGEFKHRSYVSENGETLYDAPIEIKDKAGNVIDVAKNVVVDYEIEGAATATGLATVVSTVITLWYFSRPNTSGLHFVSFPFIIVFHR